MVTSPIASKALVRVGESLTSSRRGSGRRHQGVDLFAAVGTPVFAPVDGVVLRVVNGGAGRLSQQKAGWFVDLKELASGWVHRLLHLGADAAERAKVGTSVKAGQQIATVGGRDSSGIKHSRPHLHYEIATADYDSDRRDYGPRVDPLTVLPINDYLKARGIGAIAMDIDWKTILDKAIDIGGPIVGKVIDVYAPGAGAAVDGGLSAVKTNVVDVYLPSNGQTASPPKQPPQQPSQPEAVAAADQTRKAAESYLLSRGWTPDQVREHLDGPKPPGPPTKEFGPSVVAAPTQAKYQEALLDRVLAQAGWTKEQREALMQGPSGAEAPCISCLRDGLARPPETPRTVAVAGPPPAGEAHMDHIVRINPSVRKG